MSPLLVSWLVSWVSPLQFDGRPPSGFVDLVGSSGFESGQEVPPRQPPIELQLAFSAYVDVYAFYWNVRLCASVFYVSCSPSMLLIVCFESCLGLVWRGVT